MRACGSTARTAARNPEPVLGVTPRPDAYPDPPRPSPSPSLPFPATLRTAAPNPQWGDLTARDQERILDGRPLIDVTEAVDAVARCYARNDPDRDREITRLVDAAWDAGGVAFYRPTGGDDPLGRGAVFVPEGSRLRG